MPPRRRRPWVKPVRISNSLSAMSSNGTSWTQVGSATTVTMSDPIYLGLAQTSGSTSATNTVTFETSRSPRHNGHHGQDA